MIDATTVELPLVAAPLPAIRRRPARRRVAWHRAGRGIVRTTAGLALAWLLPLAAQATGTGLLSPVLVLLATAGLLRVGHSLLDRLMVGLALLLGATTLAGLGSALWPWGLHQVPLAGTALTVLVLVSTLTGRPFRLPRPAWSDATVVATAVAVPLYLVKPLATASFGRRIGMLAYGEDLARHLSLAQGISQVGGYLFERQDAAAPLVYPALTAYPQGWHLTAALLDGYLAPGALAGGQGALTQLVILTTATYGLLTLAVGWAVLWIGGPLLRAGARPLLVAGVVGSALAFSDVMLVYSHGYPSQCFGLAELALLVAVLVRPVGRWRTQIVAVAALLVALGFSYYLYLPAAAIATALWALRYRRELLWHWPCAAAVLPVLAVAAFPLLYGLRQHQLAGLDTVGTPRMAGRDLTLALLLIALAGTLAARRARAALWRRYWLALTGPGALLVAVGAWQLHGRGTVGYYFEKSLLALEVLALLGMGAVANLLPPPRRRAPGIRRLTGLAPAVALGVAAYTVIGGFWGDSSIRGPDAPAPVARQWA
ncbi:MAG TPA: hypothetical protein VHA75_12545, partial [Rugosimonospora sp.]|nr:hypothetical protein [Rugosimonospora sp.]